MYPSTNASWSCLKPKASRRCSAFPTRISSTCSSRRSSAAGRWSLLTMRSAPASWRRRSSRMTGKPGLCIGTLGPGIANMAGAMMCAKVENSPVIFLGGQRARITEQTGASRTHSVRQAGGSGRALGEVLRDRIEYANQTDEIIREALRVAQTGTPGPVYIEYPQHVILEDLDVPEPMPPEAYRLVSRARARRDRQGRAAHPSGKAAHPAGRARRAYARAPASRSRSSPS